MAFAILCESYAAWCELLELARKDGHVVRVNGQPQPNPYAVRADREAEKVRRLLAESGGSPASRTRLSVNTSTVPSDPDDVTAFLSQPREPRMRIAK